MKLEDLKAGLDTVTKRNFSRPSPGIESQSLRPRSTTPSSSDIQGKSLAENWTYNRGAIAQLKLRTVIISVDYIIEFSALRLYESDGGIN
jgi:hypothetical protein